MTSRCRVVMSLGITRSFPRLYPIMGLVTVALLTLAPLALRPVRLACLIHAANVHSEPGSNPSKSERHENGQVRPQTLPQTERVEESDWSHRSVPPREFPLGVEQLRCRFRETALALRTENPSGSHRATTHRRLPSRAQQYDPPSTGLRKKRNAAHTDGFGRSEPTRELRVIAPAVVTVRSIASFLSAERSLKRLMLKHQHT